ncbi:fatty acid desaturase [Variovorax sp. SG517]|uniref:hypothetical protein n=1 Tax=Variovorax sp. SG517 TaxID=2587117 RepID=UPI00159E81A5|nr:hypothetical protein [Variovorax sp. SG517]NVM93196.1 fatty acid desaturase [Variovorax sp. SG517]
MTGNRLRPAHAALAALMAFAPLACAAESTVGTGSATARVRLVVVVPPVFQVLGATQTAEGRDYLVWTNMRSITIGGREYRFARPGENTVHVPAAPVGAWVVHGL